MGEHWVGRCGMMRMRGKGSGMQNLEKDCRG